MEMDLAISHNLQCMEWNAIELIADMQSRVIIVIIIMTFVKFHVSLSRDCQRQSDRDKTTQRERECVFVRHMNCSTVEHTNTEGLTCTDRKTDTHAHNRNILAPRSRI